MQLSLIFLSILGLAIASPVDVTNNNEDLLRNAVARNSIFENLILNMLEDFRRTMLTGSDDIPVLEPLHVEHLHLDEETLTIHGAHVTINDMKVSKLSTFVIDSLDVRSASIILQRYRVEFDIYIPVVEVDAANYDLSVSASGANIFGNGDAKINLIEPRVKGSLLLGPRFSIGSGFYLTILTSQVNFTLKACDSHINGLLNDDSMSAFINIFLNHFVPELVQLYEEDISKVLSETVKEIGNEFLTDLNLSSILG